MSPTRIYGRSLALLTDLYQLTMACAFERSGRADDPAVFHLTFRNAPFGGQWIVACGLRPLLEAIEDLHFDEDDLAYVASLESEEGRPLFERRFLDWLGEFRFRGDVHAMAEGTVCFPGEPVLRVEGGVAECQMLETLVLNQMNYASAIATKAARLCHVAAAGQPVLEFGLRRAPGIGGGVSATRAAWIGGCSATSNLLAGRVAGIPVRGTHAHSWVLAFDSEPEAFDAYVEALPHNAVLLVDTYDTRRGVDRAIAVAERMRARGQRLAGIRLDSGDLFSLSRWARNRLDDAGLGAVRILASGGLDELEVAELRRRGAAIDVWGVGTRLVAAGSGVDGVFKMGMIRRPGRPWSLKMKSTDDPRKASLPGSLQVRRESRGGVLECDTIYDLRLGSAADEPTGPPAARECRDLLQPVLRDGRAVITPDDREARERVRAEIGSLPERVRQLEGGKPFPVERDSLLAEKIDELRTRPVASQ